MLLFKRCAVLLFVGAMVFAGCSEDKKDTTTTGPGAPFEISGDITENTTWTADNDYLLVGQTFVKAGATLTIEAGTTIRSIFADPNGLAPALAIERGAKIMAEGTASAPITFTSDLPTSVLPQRGTWGGLIILGRAPINVPGGESFVEGLVGVPFGGTDPNDDSGVLRYVRVWYGGRSIGQDNEINGITLAGVGRGTTVEYCEVAWNLDDGFEMFGGTVDLKHCSVLFVGDDGFDTDLGYQGRGQFLFVMVGTDEGNRAYEMDNNGDNMDAQPRSLPQFHNTTLIGSGAGATADNDQMIRLREGSGGDFRNMIIAGGKEYGVNITDDATLALIGGDLELSSNNIIYNCASGQFKDDYGLTAQNINPQFRNMGGHETGGTIDPRPATGSPAMTGGEELPNDGFFEQVSYIGAFGTDLWLDGWSWLSEDGRLP